MGACEYRYNVSENYQRTKPGMAPETNCGGRTYPAQDDPEMRLVQQLVPNGEGGTVPVDRWVATGRMVNRVNDDPYCPLHGGSSEPPPVQVTLTEIEVARQHYEALAAQYQGVVPPPPVPAVPPVPAIESQQADGVAQFNAFVAAGAPAHLEIGSPE